MPKTRLTGFSRLLIFLLFFLPLAYIGASYYNGEDPIAKIKGLFGGDEPTEVVRPSASPETAPAPEAAPATFENVAKLREELADLKVKLATAEAELVKCRNAAGQ